MKKMIVLGFVLLLSVQLQAQFIVNDGITLTNTINISTNGDWVNDGSFTNNGSLYLSESWTNLGTYEATSTGKITLDYAFAKSFNHNGQSIATLLKLGVGPADVVGNLLIEDSLLLVDGRLNFAGDSLVLSPSVVIQNSSTSYVKGPVTHIGTGTKYFPIGDGTNRYPVTLTNISGASPKVTAHVEPYSGGYTAGAGIDSLLNSFPIQWRIGASAQTDTASFMQMNFFNGTVSNPNLAVVARLVGINVLEGMGQRALTNSNGLNTITTYSKGLRGLFTLAAGFAGNLETDSLALVTFYNNTGAAAWSKDANWLTGNIATWQGVTETGGSITSLVLDNANINGPMNNEIAEILSLQTVNVASNNLSSIPDFTSLTALTSLNVSNNALDFGSLETNATLGAVIDYTNQKPIDLLVGDSVLVNAGSDFELSASVGGTQNTYTVKRNTAEVSTSTGDTYVISSIDRDNMGEYEVAITNPLVPNLTLTTVPVSILAVADIQGRTLVDATTPATAGIMNLFRITSTGAYDTVQTISINSNGEYVFENVVLDDYIILSKPSSTVYPTVIPTYYANTIFWEEATPVLLDTAITNLDVVAQFIPSGTPSGQGSLSGFVLEDDGTGDRTEKTSRVKGSGVSARRAQDTGRGGAIVYVVVAYTETDENGEFNLPELPTGDYRLNIQYPGFPMDETSFIEFAISTNPLEKDVQVEATIIDNKISVRELLITGLFEALDYNVSVHPNPAVETINISFENPSQHRELILLNAQGQALKQQAANEISGSMGVKDLASGTYLLQVKDKNQVKKMVRIVIR